MIVIFLNMFLIIYVLVNFYIGLRLWQSLGRFIPFLHPAVYWAAFFSAALSYIFGRMSSAFLPKNVTDALTLAGSYWMGAMIYFFLLVAFADIVLVAARLFRFVPKSFAKGFWRYPAVGMALVLIVTGIVTYGYINARNPRITAYSVNIPKKAVDLKELKVAMVSDMHLGVIVGRERLAEMVEMINALEPDIVLFGGDIIDEDIGLFVKEGMGEELKKLKSRYGSYAVFGNHEYFRGQTDDIVRELRQAGVSVLRDGYVKVADSFYIAGREDRGVRRVGGIGRRPLRNILEGIDASLPVILLDHQPGDLDESRLAGVDLQLSGHTHGGQVFPIRFITERIYEIDWGYLRKGSLQVIVSSGFGTWGIPIRTGSFPEVVSIKITFGGGK